MAPGSSSDIARELRFTLASVALAAASILLSGVALSAGQTEVSQQGRRFNPTAITLNKGDTLHIVNNDADLLHHAYVDAPGFKFDSGEQQPGTSVDIKFTQAGQFEVLCGIHPKMLLTVSVK
jgi:plastocyanin